MIPAGKSTMILSIISLVDCEMNCTSVYIILIFFVGQIFIIKSNESISHPRLTMSQKFQILQNYFKHRDKFSFDNSERLYDQIRFRSNSIDDSISLMKPTDEDVSTKWSIDGYKERFAKIHASSETTTATTYSTTDINKNDSAEITTTTYFKFKVVTKLLEAYSSDDPARDDNSSMHTPPFCSHYQNTHFLFLFTLNYRPLSQHDYKGNF